MSEQPTKRRRETGPWVLPPPWLPPAYEIADVVAVQSCSTGEASAEQQKRAIKWIVEQGCATYDIGWHPSGPHEASFAAGRRFSGLCVVKLTRLNVAVLKKESNAG